MNSFVCSASHAEGLKKIKKNKMLLTLDKTKSVWQLVINKSLLNIFVDKCKQKKCFFVSVDVILLYQK